MGDMGSEKPLASEAWERLADAYAEQIDTKPHNAYLERPATLSLLPSVHGKHALDAGCGPGVNAEWLIKHGAEVTAVDASQKMVEHAKKRLGESADVRLHDIEKPLTFLVDRSIDIVLAALVMDYIKDWVPVFNEFKRVLKDNGVLVFSASHPFIDFQTKEDIGDYFRIERSDMLWRTWGTPILMPSYRRPLGYMTETVLDAGFLIDRVIEARPTLEYKRADPEGYERVSRRPSFICVRAVSSR